MNDGRPEPRRILAVQTAFLGDVVLATPLLAALRGRFPESWIAFMGTPAGVELIGGLAGVDELIAFDKRGAEKGLGGIERKARELSEKNFDLAVSAHRSARTGVLLARSRIPRRIGFATSDLPWLHHQRVPWDPAAHEIERDLALLEPLGGPPPGFEPRPRLPELEPAGPDLLGPDGGGPRVGLCPGSVWPTKRYPAQGFGRAAKRLRAEFGARIYLIGSASDREAAAEVEAELGEGVVNLAGRTGLRDWARLIAAMDLVVTNDSAPTHVAAAFGIPTVTIYGPTTLSLGFGPRSPRSRTVEVPGLACRPCGRHGSRRCPEGHFKCMGLIAADQVAAAAGELLAGKD